jgi:hypothetical protein
MSKHDLSYLKAPFNTKHINQAFVNILSEKQENIVKKLLKANDLNDVKLAQGAWFELEKLKTLVDEINGAEQNG